MFQTTTRNATGEDLVAVLRLQQSRKLDLVVPAARIRSENAHIVVTDGPQLISQDEMISTDGIYRPTEVGDEGIAAKLDIPRGYLRRMRAQRPDLYDANVNAWLHGQPLAQERPSRAAGTPAARSFLLRCFRADEDSPGIMRAFLSEKFARIENLDVLTAALDGVRQAGIDILINGADLSERRMFVRITAPAIAELAPDLLRGYRSPFSGLLGTDNPTVFAGLEIRNSEVGAGAYTITPRLVVQVCENGMTLTKDAVRAVHLGARLDEGTIAWTEDTHRKAIELITAKTRDAVTTFLNIDYMRRVLRGLESCAGTPLSAPADTISVVGKSLAYDEATINGVLEHFIRGGQITAGAVMHAVTSYAQTVPDAETAVALEAHAVQAMELAAATV
jgi:hypothetical protein